MNEGWMMLTTMGKRGTETNRASARRYYHHFVQVLAAPMHLFAATPAQQTIDLIIVISRRPFLLVPLVLLGD